jgi:putative endonuclease
VSWLRGLDAESRARRELEARGLRFIERNWRCAGGELDLLMLDGVVLAIIEVRARSGADYGSALESVDARKRGRIVRAARRYLAGHPEHGQREVRFDVVALDGRDLQWLKAAFDADG